jgi:GntR family transcriptional regulator
MIHINRRNDRPIYKQIYDGFRLLIESGKLKAGDLIPSERELCEQLEISRMTVRAAVDQLVRDGLLIRKHGSGTVVSASKITKNALGFMSFTEELVASQLGLPVGARVIYFERVRLANNEPMALEKGYLPYDRFSGILESDLDHQSLYELLERDYNCYPEVAEEVIEAVLLNTREARLLGISSRSPALLAQHVTRDSNNEIVETVQTLYRGDRYRMFFMRRRPD